MRMLTLITAAAATTSLAGAAAAQQPAAASSLPGTYELVEVKEAPLPVTVEEKGNCVEQVTAGKLILEPGGSWKIELTEVETCGTDVDTDMETEDGRYSVNGSSINFRADGDAADDPDPNELDLDEAVSGTIEGDMIHVTMRDNVVAVFRRSTGN